MKRSSSATRRARRGRAIATGLIGPVAVVIGPASAVVAGSDGPSAASPQRVLGVTARTYASVARVESAVKNLAERNGDPALTSMTVFRTDRAHADQAVDVFGPAGGRGALEPMTVVYARGDFVGVEAKVPPGAPHPTGHVLVVVLNQVGQISDWGLHQTMPSRQITSDIGRPRTYRLS